MTTGSPQFQHVRDLFDRALEQPAVERAAYVAAQAAGDEALASEVLALLAAFDSEAELLEQPAIAALVTHAAPTASDAAAEAGPVFADRRVGHYRLLRCIGEGGMGAVYEAVRADDQFDKRVALKVVRGGLPGDAVQRRFRRERQILAQLDHPGIARLLDGGMTERGEPYLVMEYVEGMPLTTYCDERRLDVAGRLGLFRQVCDAVQYAHRNLVVHRDLKPGNILVTAEGAVKLLDFGVSKLLHAEEPDTEGTVTQLGGRFLTPAYASPEQLRGEPVSTSSDVYSLGVILYELLCGQRPLELGGHSPVEVARALEVDPTRPSEVARTRVVVGTGEPRTPRLRRKLSAELDNIVLMALRKDPARRYASVEQLSEDVRRFLTGMPVLAQGDSAGYRLRKFAGRHRTGLAAVALLILALAGGVAGTGWQARRATQHAAEAELQRRKAERVAAFVADMLRSADPGIRGRDVKVADVLDEAAQRARVELAGEPEVQAGVQSAIGQAYTGLGLFGEAEPLLHAALETFRRSGGGRGTEYLAGLDHLADLHFQEQQFDSARLFYEQELAALAREPRPDSLRLAAVLGGLGRIHNWLGDPVRAETLQREALALWRGQPGARPEQVAEALNDLGVVLGQQARWSEAEPLHREALRLVRGVRGERHPEVAQELANLAFILEQQKKYPAADSFYRAALALRTELLGPDHPDVAWTRQNYAGMLYDRGDYAAAMAGARQVLALRGRTLPENHVLVSSALQLLGRGLVRTGQAKEGERVLRESLELRRRSYPPDHWLVASAESVLGECLVRRGKLAEAERLLLRADRELRARLGPQHPRTLENVARLAALYTAAGDPVRAAEYRARSLPSGH
jgi:tetratricopeptide (TPR) repeat protein